MVYLIVGDYLRDEAFSAFQAVEEMLILGGHEVYNPYKSMVTGCPKSHQTYKMYESIAKLYLPYVDAVYLMKGYDYVPNIAFRNLLSAIYADGRKKIQIER